MKTSEFILKAKAHIEKGWHQGTLYKDALGETTVYSSKACSFCAAGAVNQQRNIETVPNVWCLEEDAKRYLSRAAVELGYEHYVDFNDTPGRTKEEVLALFNSAARIANENRS